MPHAATFDPAVVVADGLSVVVELSNDPSLAVGGSRFYRAVEATLGPEIRASDRATIAVPCVRMEDRLPALLLVLQDRAMLAWTAGIFRKESHVETVPLRASWGATVAPGIGARHTVMVLTVQWSDQPPWVLAVPSDSSTTRFLRTCFVAAH